MSVKRWLARALAGRRDETGAPGGALLAEVPAPADLERSPARLLAALRQMRGSPREHAALEAALAALATGAGGEELRGACAEVLAARGEEEEAERLLEPCSAPASLLVLADLRAACGALEGAVEAIERALARDLDLPGARERHARWRAALGRPQRVRGRVEAPTELAAGASSPYRLLREVARGGAGTVYEAEEVALGRRVALKVYHRRGEADLALLRAEARTAAELAGPGVVRVLDVDLLRGSLTLEWIGRGSVGDLLRRGDAARLLPLAGISLPLSRALARVHRAGLVHGDVKPGNVLVRAPDDPVLADFGVAVRDGEPARGGTPGYLSPELIAGRPARPTDDVYAFGRVLLDVLAGLEAAGVDGGAEAAALRAVATACVAPAGARPSCGVELSRLLRA